MLCNIRIKNQRNHPKKADLVRIIPISGEQKTRVNQKLNFDTPSYRNI